MSKRLWVFGLDDMVHRLLGRRPRSSDRQLNPSVQSSGQPEQPPVQGEQLTASELALRVGRSRQHINLLARRGTLRRGSGGFFDLADSKNAAFLRAHEKPPDVAMAAPPPAGPPPEVPAPDLPRSELERRKIAQVLRKLELANRRAAGQLVERPSVVAFMGRLVAALNNELLALPQRLGPDLAAAARGADQDDAAAVLVGGILQRELYSCLRSVTASTRSFLRDLYGEQPGGAGPVELQAALEEVRGALERTIQEVRESGGAIA